MTAFRIGRWQVSLEGAVLLLALGGVLGMGACQDRAAAARRAELQALRAQLRQHQVTVVRTDTVYARDTVRLWRTVAHYDTVRRTDTLVRGDTVWIPRAAADAAIEACVATVRSCEARVAARDSVIRVQARIIETFPSPRPAALIWAERAAFFAAGVWAARR